MAIGVWWLSAQFGLAQEATAVATDGPGWITRKDERLRDRFRQLLLAVPTRDLASGWQLASDMGRPAVKVLWELLAKENSDVEHRLVLLAAAMMAGTTHEDERLFGWLDQQKPMLEERTMAAMLVALGPSRVRPMPNFWPRFLGGAKTPEQLLAIAVCLASVRVPGSQEGAPVWVSDDPGLAAAMAYAGLAVPTSVTSKFWNLRAPERHADLFWRGALLGAAREPAVARQADALLERATELMRLPGESLAAGRSAATWLRAVAGDLRADEPRLDIGLLRVATGDLAAAQTLQVWLSPEALPRDLEPQRLAVAWALSRRPEVVIEQRAVWSADARIRRHVAVALAWRLAGAASPTAIEVSMPDLAEWNFVRAASGSSVDRGASCDDAKLAAALPLLADGRCDRVTLRSLCEETLWRWGSHPRLAPFELERLFLRDVLLAGSNAGGNKYQTHLPPDQRYCPSGLDRGDRFFSVAVALFEFLVRPRAPLPSEHRLQG